MSEIACQWCTCLNPALAIRCSLCHARLPKGRVREKDATDEEERRKAAEEAAKPIIVPKTTMEEDGYVYREVGAFPPGWVDLVDNAAAAAENLLRRDALREKKERQMETINSNRRQLRFVVEGVPEVAGPAKGRYVALTDDEQAIRDVANGLKAQFGPEMADWVPQDMYVLFTPGEEEGSRARAAQSWHLDALKKFAVAALVLRGAHATEFPVGAYSDFSEGVAHETLDAWTKILRTDAPLTDAGRESESVEEHDHFTHHLRRAGLTTGPNACNWAKLETAPAPKAPPGFATTFWSNKVHRGPATRKGEERLVLFCTWLPPGMARPVEEAATAHPTESETDYSYKACHLEPKLRLSTAASEAAAAAFADYQTRRVAKRPAEDPVEGIRL